MRRVPSIPVRLGATYNGPMTARSRRIAPPLGLGLPLLAGAQGLSPAPPDGGPTWSAPVEINGKRGLPRDDNGALEGFAGAVGSDGTLYAVWSGTSTLAVHVVARWRPDVRSRARHPADRAHDVSTTGLFARQRVSVDCGGPARRQVRAGVRDLERLPQWWRGCVLRDIRR
jgi:hypothetical protein